MDTQAGEAVCPCCIRLVRLTPKRRTIATHKTYGWLLVNRTNFDYSGWISTEAKKCPGTWRKPLAGDPEGIGQPPSCPL